MAIMEVDVSGNIYQIDVPDDIQEHELSQIINDLDSQGTFSQQQPTQQTTTTQPTTIAPPIQPSNAPTGNETRLLGDLPHLPLSPQQGLVGQAMDVAGQAMAQPVDFTQGATQPEPTLTAQAPVPMDFPSRTQDVYGEDIDSRGLVTDPADDLFYTAAMNAPDSFNRLVSSWGEFLSSPIESTKEAISGVKEVGLALATNALDTVGIDVSSRDPEVKAMREALALKIGEGLMKLADDPQEALRMAARNPFQVAEMLVPLPIKKIPGVGKVAELANTAQKAVRAKSVDKVIEFGKNVFANTAVRRATKGKRDEFKKLTGGNETLGSWLVEHFGSDTMDGYHKQASAAKANAIAAANKSLENVPGKKLQITEDQLKHIIGELRERGGAGKSVQAELVPELKKFKDLLKRNQYFEDSTIMKLENKIDSLKTKRQRTSVGGMVGTEKLDNAINALENRVAEMRAANRLTAPSATEMHMIQRAFTEMEDMYKARQPDVKKGMEGFEILRNKMKKQLEYLAEANGVHNFKQINQEIQKAHLAKTALETMDETMVTGFDTIIGAVAPKTLAVKKGLESPKVNSFVANFLRNLSSRERSMLASREVLGYNTPESKVIYGRLLKGLAGLGYSAKLLSPIDQKIQQLEHDLENERAKRKVGFTPSR